MLGLAFWSEEEEEEAGLYLGCALADDIVRVSWDRMCDSAAGRHQPIRGERTCDAVCYVPCLVFLWMVTRPKNELKHHKLWRLAPSFLHRARPAASPTTGALFLDGLPDACEALRVSDLQSPVTVFDARGGWGRNPAGVTRLALRQISDAAVAPGEAQGGARCRQARAGSGGRRGSWRSRSGRRGSRRRCSCQLARERDPPARRLDHASGGPLFCCCARSTPRW
jgi:hypothetical protein